MKLSDIKSDKWQKALSKSKTLRIITTYLIRDQTVDLGIKQFNLCRYKTILISIICFAVSWLVYIGLLFLFTYVKKNQDRAA